MISASLQACGVVFQLAISTSICRSNDGIFGKARKVGAFELFRQLFERSSVYRPSRL